jgi:hypothetical protein
MTRIDGIVEGIYRISTAIDVGEFDFQFNQLLIDDERPALIHTGVHAMEDDVRTAVAQVLDPRARVRGAVLDPRYARRQPHA